jgi:hypothetical protein
MVPMQGTYVPFLTVILLFGKCLVLEYFVNTSITVYKNVL